MSKYTHTKKKQTPKQNQTKKHKTTPPPKKKPTKKNQTQKTKTTLQYALYQVCYGVFWFPSK